MRGAGAAGATGVGVDCSLCAAVSPDELRPKRRKVASISAIEWKKMGGSEAPSAAHSQR